ncbi:MAG TPA: hypothetical protein VMJ10_09160 [Kofleriaceae bacterium]|nr:hypothetical protein [Kofleriaceae bacterium]
MSVVALARVAWRRLLRRYSLWIAIAIAIIPIPFAYDLRGEKGILTNAFNIALLLLAVLPPWLVGSALGEELDHRAATYLWSRPLARWKVIAAKLIALAPIVVVLAVGSWVAIAYTATTRWPPGVTVRAVAACALAVSVISAGISALAPRQGMALAIVYVMFDLLLGELPASLHALSVTFHARVLASRSHYTPDVFDWLLLAAIPIVWLVIGLLRLRRREA